MVQKPCFSEVFPGTFLALEKDLLAPANIKKPTLTVKMSTLIPRATQVTNLKKQKEGFKEACALDPGRKPGEAGHQGSGSKTVSLSS